MVGTKKDPPERVKVPPRRGGEGITYGVILGRGASGAQKWAGGFFFPVDGMYHAAAALSGLDVPPVSAGPSVRLQLDHGVVAFRLPPCQSVADAVKAGAVNLAGREVVKFIMSHFIRPHL